MLRLRSARWSAADAQTPRSALSAQPYSAAQPPYALPTWRSATAACRTTPALRPGGRVVFVQHGMARDGCGYREVWITAADRHGPLILAVTP